MKIPYPGSEVKVVDAIQLCRDHDGYQHLAERMTEAQDNLPESWVFDGCSHWFDTYDGFPVYKVCFFHDCAYLAGGTEAQRLEADALLLAGLARMTGSVGFPMATFTGVRIGGDAAWKKSFSWGYGHQPEK